MGKLSPLRNTLSIIIFSPQIQSMCFHLLKFYMTKFFRGKNTTLQNCQIKLKRCAYYISKRRLFTITLLQCNIERCVLYTPKDGNLSM